MENMKGEDGLKDLKRLLNTPTEQHPEYSVDELMREHLAYSELFRGARQQVQETPED